MLATAHQESGNRAKAGDLLDQAEELYTEESPQRGIGDGRDNWYDWLICELLLEEAQGKIAGGEEQDDVAPTEEESASE